MKEVKNQVRYRKLKDLKKLENNPRQISKKDMEILKTSIKDNPEFLEARPLILSDRTGELVINCNVIRKRYWTFVTGSEDGWQEGTVGEEI